ncbi:MAG TPA: hypothetical protein VFZ56_00005, partial [Gemmatimonadaceae bacterium]
TASARDVTWVAGGLVLAGLLGLAVPPFVNALRVFGRYIPQDRIEFDYLFGLIWATAIALSIRFWPVRDADKRALVIVWLAKVFVTLGAMLVYEWNYELDAYGYYGRSIMPGLPPAGTAWSAGTVAVTRFAWIHSQILPDSFHAMKVTFAAIGLVAVYVIYRGAVRFRGVEDRRMLYWIALFPSILFWSSTIGKEPLHLLGIAIYVYGVLSWRATGRAVHGVTVAIGVALAFLIRSWSGPILLFPLIIFAVMGIRRPMARIAFVAIALVAFLWSVGRFATMFNIETIRDVQSAAEARSVGWAGGSAQERTEKFTGIGSMIRFAPLGAFTALFRPLPGEVRNPFGIVAGIENAFLLGLLLIAIARARLRRLRDPAIAWAILLIVTWSFIYSFVSYYNFGAAVRFKLQILPVLLLVLLYLARGPDDLVPAEARTLR